MRISALVVLSLAVAGCGLLGKKGEDAGAPDAEVVAPVPVDAVDAAAVVEAPGAPHGKNAAMVGRFASEIHMNEPKMLGQAASPRTSPGAGAVVSTLKAGTVVTRIATNANQSLIVFPDPNVPTDNLMGWVSDAAFSAAVVPKPVVTDGGAVVVADAGAVAPVDAGAPAPVDAGAPFKPTVCTKPGNVAVKLGTGSAWACRHVCTADNQCTKGAKKCQDFDVYNPAPNTPVKTKACKDDQ